MRRLGKLFFILTCLFQSHILLAENMLFDANILYTIPDIKAKDTDDFHTGKIVNFNFNYYTHSWLALTAGLFVSEEIFENPNSDNVGTFQTSLETQGITLAIRPEYKFSDRNKVYSRLGILFYQTNLKVNEFFELGRIVGSKSRTANGNGYLFSLGWAHNFTQHVSFQLELYNQTQLDLFGGETKTDKAFDLSNSGFTLGLGYAF